MYYDYCGIASPGETLSHHGIKGQRWGIRRFQNVDGSLTPEGKERYNQSIKEIYRNNDFGPYQREHTKEHLQELADEKAFEFGPDGSGVIKKGANIHRVASENDEITDKRKYVSITEFDNQSYEDDAEYLALPVNDSAYVHNYEAINDIKVAGSKMVHDYILQQLGNEKVKDVLTERRADFILIKSEYKDDWNYTQKHGKEILKLYGNLKMKDIVDFRSGIADSYLKSDEDTWLKNRVAVSAAVTNYMYRKGLNDEKLSSKTFNHFSKLGYDAVVDMEDMGYADYPVILINPKNSIKLKSKQSLESLYHDEDYLMHHGVKGQKWGVRQWQYPDGSLTDAGRIHYGYGTSNSKIINDSRLSKLKKAQISLVLNAYSRKRLNDAKIGGDIGKKYADTYLKNNLPMYRIQSSETFNNEYAFYATYKKHDVDKYSGLFGKNLTARANAIARSARKNNSDDAEELTEKAKNMQIYQLKLSSTSKLKIPSDENAGHIVGKLLKDPQFKQDLAAAIKDSASKMKRPSQQILFKEANKLIAKDLSNLNGSDKRTIYKALNLSLTNHNEQEVRMQNKFYGALKKYGYSALLDLNDKSYSSYHAKSPVIVFDTDKVKLQSATKLDSNKIDKLYKKYNFEKTVKDIPEQIIGNISKTCDMKLSSIASKVTDAMFDYLKHQDCNYDNNSIL